LMVCIKIYNYETVEFVINCICTYLCNFEREDLDE